MQKIAIVEDCADLCQVMECLLDNYFEVSAFTDTSLFLKTSELENYQLVLVDFSLHPTADANIQNGCQLIEYLKTVLKEPPLLILFTGWISRNNLAEGRQLCPVADGFLAKDVDLKDMVQEINRFIASKSHSF